MSVIDRFNVTITGPEDAPVMLFAHGFGCDQHMWRHVAPRFAGRFRVVLFDHVGSGGSDPSAYDTGRYSTLGGYAADVLEICAELDLHDLTFVGHSVSSMIGVLASIEEPDRFARLVLVSPSPRYIDEAATSGAGAGGPDEVRLDPYRGGFSAADIAELLDSLESNYLGRSGTMAPAIMGNADRPDLGAELTESFCRVDPAIARHFAQVTFESDNRADLPKVTVPTLVLQCRHDAIAPVEVGEYVHRAIPGSTFVLLDATGHCPNLSAPGATTAAIAAFVGVLADA